MPDYGAAKIYKVICRKTKRVYVGSTVLPLKRRMTVHVAKHRHPETKNCKPCAASDLIGSGKAEIVLHEPYPCSTARELAIREEMVRRELIEQGVNVVNRQRAVACIHTADPKEARKCPECNTKRCKIMAAGMNDQPQCSL